MMEKYWELLNEIDVGVTREELGLCAAQTEEEKTRDYIMTLPEDYYGNFNICRESGFALNYDDTKFLVKKKFHEYSRVARFRWTFAHLISNMGKISEKCYEELNQEVGKRIPSCPFRAYNIIYKELKKRKLREYYISIPYILNRLGGKRWNLKTSDFIKVENKFLKLHHLFNNNKHLFKRKRFPKLQYIALKLLEDINISPPYHIPKVRTNKKRKSLDPLFSYMLSLI